MRLDKYLFENGYASSRSKAQSLIAEGLVCVNGKIIDKASYELFCNENITIFSHSEYVSRGAYKLITAIEKFNIDFKERVVIDIGASTGGFTQVALEHGAKKVYAIDVGRGELAESLASDRRVVNLENTDFRAIKKEQVQDANIIVGDISFISLKHIFPKIKELFNNIEIVILFKPQFECGKEIAKKYKGVIKDKSVHKSLLKDFLFYLQGLNFAACNLTYSQVTGKSGNIEYLFSINGKEKANIDVDSVVDAAFEYFKNLKNK